MAARSVLPAIVVVSLMLTHEAFALSNPCDDGMGGDQGFSLKKVYALPASGPPANLSWVRPLVNKAIRNQADLDAIFTWPRGTPKKRGCKLQSYTWKKLCVPKSGARGAFRAKVQLKTKCGTMIVKYRISSSGQALVWGRSKT